MLQPCVVAVLLEGFADKGELAISANDCQLERVLVVLQHHAKLLELCKPFILRSNEANPYFP